MTQFLSGHSGFELGILVKPLYISGHPLQSLVFTSIYQHGLCFGLHTPAVGQKPPSASEQLCINNQKKFLTPQNQGLALDMVTPQKISTLGPAGYIPAGFTTVLKSITFKIENVTHASIFY